MSIKKLAKCEFVFTQDGEFDDPYYSVILDGYEYGELSYSGGKWLGSFYYRSSFSSRILNLIAKKLDELNESLAQERSNFFGF